MKKILKSLVLIFSLFLFSGKVNASDISSINMDIYIDSNGDAHVKETWNASIYEGTEGYRFYSNMGNSLITNFTVSDQSRTYSDIGEWDVYASFSDKAYKSGIVHYYDHDELCFGISNYGDNTYTLNYTITNFVSEIDDADMVYWELIPSALVVDKVYIKIYSDFSYSSDLPVWGYGNYGGYAYVYDGIIEMSNDNLSSDEYMTILVKFDKGTFNTSNVIEGTFDVFLSRAEEGADHYESSYSSSSDEDIWWVVLANFFTFGVVFGTIAFLCKNTNNKCGSRYLDFGEKGKKFPKDDMMFRELPCGKDLYRAYWLASSYNLMKKNTDFLGAILLKWTKEGKIIIQSEEKGLIIKKDETKIILNNNNTFDTDLEKSLYSYIYEASKDGILESKEFERWCSKHYTKILNWFDKVLDYESDILEKEGKLSLSDKKTFFIKKHVVSPLLYEEAHKLKGLKNFFDDIGNMKDKSAIEVNLWEEYLMYAQIFGLAKKVAKQFKEIYPDVITDDTYYNMMYINTISHSGISSANSAKSRAESYSSGGGGFSSGGGGGGSFGGGGGGGFR